MKVISFVMGCVAMVLMTSGAPAFAEDSCTWSQQPDGSQWGTCVDNNGRMYCVQCKGNSCSRVGC